MKNLNVKKTVRNLSALLASVFMLSLSATQSFAAQSVTASSSVTQQKKVEQALNQQNAIQQDNVTEFTEAQLEQMLAPIALYPDSLLSHILIASTYPIEVVDAERWLEKNSKLASDTDDQALLDAAEDQDWDASVKALLPFPNILKKLSNDLHWMTDLGDAFLQDQEKVLTSIQSLRQQADVAGNLDKMDNVNVVRETKTIIIQPAEPEIIYVPYYDTRVVYGDWRWSRYPPIHWHYPSHYTRHRGPYYWHNPVHLSLGLFFGSVHWRSHHVVVHRHKSRYYKRHSNERITTNRSSQKWQHKPRHRKGVAYRNNRIQQKYRSNIPSVERHKKTRSQQLRIAKKSKIYDAHIDSRHKNVSNKLKAKHATRTFKHSKDKHVSRKRVETKQVLNKRKQTVHKHNPKRVSDKQRNTKKHYEKQNLAKVEHVKNSHVKASQTKKTHIQPKRVEAKPLRVKRQANTQVKRTSYKSEKRKSSNNRAHKGRRSSQKSTRRNEQKRQRN